MDKLAEARKQIKFTQFNNIEDSYDMEDIWSDIHMKTKKLYLY